MGWQDGTVVDEATPAPEPVAQTGPQPAWEMGRLVRDQPTARAASGPLEALQAGYQASATGLAIRGRLPDVILAPQHAKWYEKALATVGQTGAEVLEMFAGGVAGSVAGTAVGGPVGAVLGTGAGAFAVPAAIRSALIEAYKSGTVDSSGGFLNAAKIVLAETAKEAGIGALTFGAGGLAARLAGKAIAPAIGESLSVPAARAAIGTAQTVAEAGTMVVAPAALEGRLPEWDDLLNAGIVIAGMKGAAHLAAPIAARIGDVYAKTGIRPEQVVADARANPAIADELATVPKEGEQAELPLAYQPQAEADMLANALPVAPKIAEIIANPRGTITDGKEPNHINYTYSEAPEDVQALRAKIAETMKDEIETARGKESWDATQSKAEGVITNRLAGMSDDQRAEMSSMAFSDLAAQSMAVEAMAQRAAYDARAAATRITEFGAQATQADHAALVAAIEQSALLHAIDQGNGAEIARALNSRKAATQRGELAESMSDVLQKYSDDPQVLARLVLGLHTTAEVTKFAEHASRATTWEKVVEGWKAGILSGPLTHMANIIGNFTFMAMRPAVDLTAAAIGKLSGMDERVSAVEPFARIFGNIKGAQEAVQSMVAQLGTAYEEGGLRGLAKEIAVGSDTGPQKGEQFRKAIGGIKGDIIRLPFRFLSLADDLFKTLNERGEAYALATRQAIGDGLNLQTREFRERVADLVQNDDEIAKASADAALRFTFNTPLGEKGEAVQNLIRKAHLELFVPFIRTPGNILKELVRLTPLAPVIGEWRAAIEGGGAERAKALAELTMGSAVMSAVVAYAMDGKITGQGPSDPGKRRIWLAAGNQPYSWKHGDTFYNYQRLQPIGTLIGIAADVSEIWDHTTEEESNKVPQMIAIAFANAVTNQTFLQGITTIVNAMSDPRRFVPKMAQQYAGSVVPAIIAQPVQMNDPLVREVNSMLDAIRARLPGREDMMPRRDPFGEPIETRERAGGITPISESEMSDDPVRTEAARLGVSVGDAPKQIHIGRGTGKIGQVDITPEQRNNFTDVSGHIAHDILQPIVTSATWAALPALTQRRVYQRAFTIAHKRAAMEVFPVGEREALVGQITEKMETALRPSE